jgi:non-heme chloroperoxidase
MRLDFYDSASKIQAKHEIPLLFVHGAWLSKWCWQENFIPYFESFGYRCLAVDLRGHGGSDGKDQINKSHIDDYVNDVQSVAERFKGKLVLVGHSMGGAIVEKYIQRYPVSGAVLISQFPQKAALPS